MSNLSNLSIVFVMLLAVGPCFNHPLKRINEVISMAKTTMSNINGNPQESSKFLEALDEVHTQVSLTIIKKSTIPIIAAALEAVNDLLRFAMSCSRLPAHDIEASVSFIMNASTRVALVIPKVVERSVSAPILAEVLVEVTEEILQNEENGQWNQDQIELAKKWIEKTIEIIQMIDANDKVGSAAVAADDASDVETAADAAAFVATVNVIMNILSAFRLTLIPDDSIRVELKIILYLVRAVRVFTSGGMRIANVTLFLLNAAEQVITNQLTTNEQIKANHDIDPNVELKWTVDIFQIRIAQNLVVNAIQIVDATDIRGGIAAEAVAVIIEVINLNTSKLPAHFSGTILNVSIHLLRVLHDSIHTSTPPTKWDIVLVHAAGQIIDIKTHRGRFCHSQIDTYKNLLDAACRIIRGREDIPADKLKQIEDDIEALKHKLDHLRSKPRFGHRLDTSVKVYIEQMISKISSMLGNEKNIENDN